MPFAFRCTCASHANEWHSLLIISQQLSLKVHAYYDDDDEYYIFQRHLLIFLLFCLLVYPFHKTGWRPNRKQRSPVLYPRAFATDLIGAPLLLWRGYKQSLLLVPGNYQIYTVPSCHKCVLFSTFIYHYSLQRPSGGLDRWCFVTILSVELSLCLPILFRAHGSSPVLPWVS